MEILQDLVPVSSHCCSSSYSRPQPCATVGDMPKFAKWLRSFPTFLKAKMKRATFANILMISFILFTSIGAALIFPPAGLIVAGITCGFFGFLLGLE